MFQRFYGRIQFNFMMIILFIGRPFNLALSNIFAGFNSSIKCKQLFLFTVNQNLIILPFPQ